MGVEELSREDQQVVHRARRLEKFLSQPFHVAEQFTGLKGAYVPVKETVRSFREVAEGKWDHLPEAAFHMVGGIEEAAAKAERLKRGRQ